MLNYDNTFAYLAEKMDTAEAKKYILDRLAYCKKIKPYVDYYNRRLNHKMTQHITF